MKTPTKDLFDDSTMSFGEHLEALRVHLLRAIIGLVIAAVICLYKGELIVDFVRDPIDRALKRHAYTEVHDDTKEVKKGGAKFWEDMGLNTLTELFTGTKAEKEEKAKTANGEPEALAHPDSITVHVGLNELAQALHTADPGRFPPVAASAVEAPSTVESPTTESPTPEQTASAGEPAEGSASSPAEKPQQIALTLHAPEFAQFQATVKLSQQAVTLNVQEAFMTYLKVSIVGAILLASPWIFYQLWLFVAAGLYQHERKYVYVFGTMSLGLFLTGALFCYYAVFPFVLNFLLGFNKTLEITPQIRLSEWISFAVMLPLMFGISFQLPLVMLFLERINIFQSDVYREQRRMAILVIAILSAILTPADPMSMLLMMIPLVILYELGIRLCEWIPKANTLDLDAA
ncbi:twin-arginine translocase subunit TatC [Planctomicrobium sp. SH668]|uniref:twin-arginine translocase subunit TatC n=1 Tax=Planctomicrobium sp. SH668 TaxID=3448126 RepID=UPI003F5C98FA